MSNPEMEKPTELQKNQLDALLDQLRSTAGRAEDISLTIGKLRQELNNSNMLLGRLRDVLGPQAYQWSRQGQNETWHHAIDEQRKKIEVVLK